MDFKEIAKLEATYKTLLKKLEELDKNEVQKDIYKLDENLPLRDYTKELKNKIELVINKIAEIKWYKKEDVAKKIHNSNNTRLSGILGDSLKTLWLIWLGAFLYELFDEDEVQAMDDEIEQERNGGISDDDIADNTDNYDDDNDDDNDYEEDSYEEDYNDDNSWSDDSDSWFDGWDFWVDDVDF